MLLFCFVVLLACKCAVVIAIVLDICKLEDT